MKILLAVDSSPASSFAIQEVARRPWPAGTTVHVLSVVERWDAPALVEGLNRSASELLRRAFARLQSSGICVATELLSGDPKEVILERAAGLNADLVVVGSRSATGLTRFLVGSVALAVARFAPCSVEIVRSGVRDEENPDAIRILLATDGSTCSEVAAHSIAERPWPAGSEIHILSVVEPSLPSSRTPYPPYFDPEAMEALRDEAASKAEKAVKTAQNIVAEAGLPTTGTIAVPCATPKELIVEETHRWGADLVVVGSHGRRGISRFLLGSVSEAVASHAKCSVEIIRHCN